MYGSTLLHKVFLMPPIFPSEEQIKKKKKRLTKLTEEHDLPLPLSASKNLERGAINLEWGASAPLAPP